MRLALGFVALLLPALASGHPLAPAMLELKETTSGTYDVLWRISNSRTQRGFVEPELPAGCAPDSSKRASFEAQAEVMRWSVRCEHGLDGQSVSVTGLDGSGINVIVRIERSGSVQSALLDAATPEIVVSPAAQASPAFLRYLTLGVQHLLFGFDHELFVAGLVLLVPALRRLLVTVTSFTLAHSVTLALATLGYVNVRQDFMELGIALSILVLACELARPPDAPPSAIARRPWAMAFAFGLLHGLGFAGALSEVGLPHGEIPLALFAFNVGIELGQLVLVAALLVLGTLARRLPQRRALAAIPVYVIGSLAAYWCLDRGALLAIQN